MRSIYARHPTESHHERGNGDLSLIPAADETIMSWWIPAQPDPTCLSSAQRSQPGRRRVPVEARWSAFVEALGAVADRSATGWYSMGTVDPVATSGHELERAGWMYSDDVSVPLGPQFSRGSTVRLERSLASQLHS